MAKYQRILVAVDGSESSLHALSFQAHCLLYHRGGGGPPYEGDLSLVGPSHMEELIREPCTTALTAAQDLGAAAGPVINTVCEVGRGSAFTLTLPKTCPEPREAADATPVTPSSPDAPPVQPRPAPSAARREPPPNPGGGG